MNSDVFDSQSDFSDFSVSAFADAINLPGDFFDLQINAGNSLFDLSKIVVEFEDDFLNSFIGFRKNADLGPGFGNDGDLLPLSFNGDCSGFLKQFDFNFEFPDFLAVVFNFDFFLVDNSLGFSDFDVADSKDLGLVFINFFLI